MISLGYKDSVSHPAGIEDIEVLRHATDYDLGQAMRYIWRVMWGSKGCDLEDVKTSAFYLADWIAAHEGRLENS
jgi:hypothetical protein